MDTVAMTISAIIAIIGCVVGVVGLWRAMTKDDNETAAAIAAIQTSLQYIEQDLKDIKAEFRRIETDVQHANETAGKALVTANAAHDRLDALGVDNAAKARARRGNYDNGKD